MEQTWFEMPEIRSAKLSDKIWIPLRSSQYLLNEGAYGQPGLKKEFYGLSSLAVYLDCRNEASNLGWPDLWTSHVCNKGYFDRDTQTYFSSDLYRDRNEKVLGISLVLVNYQTYDWILHQDLELTLGLKREHDVWVRPQDGYVEVIRLKKDSNNKPILIEIRASYLKDYLCARNMALYTTLYRDRLMIIEPPHNILWNENSVSETTPTARWQGHIESIHEGGNSYGSETFVMVASRTDVTLNQDVPILGLPNDENIDSRSYTKKHTGKLLYQISGELWRNEWIEPGRISPIVRDDEMQSTNFFIVDEEGTKKSSKELLDLDADGRWLWFNSRVINDLLSKRGGILKWETNNIGSIGCSPSGKVDFGVNSLGLITVYSKDIVVNLADWQQQIWAGHNISPEGGVSQELFKQQVHCERINSIAPENQLNALIEELNSVSKSKFGFELFSKHKDESVILEKCHRFRAQDESSLLTLAKDLYRFTAERLNGAKLKDYLQEPKTSSLGSLKLLEKLLAKSSDTNKAHTLMEPFFGLYDLRKDDAHLPTQDRSNALQLVNVDQTEPYPLQGHKLIGACATSLSNIKNIMTSTLS